MRISELVPLQFHFYHSISVTYIYSYKENRVLEKQILELEKSTKGKSESAV
jgi:hypothetical protein